MKEKGNLIKIRLETNNQRIDENFTDFLRMPRHWIISGLILRYCSRNSELLDIGAGKNCEQLRFLRKNGFVNLTGLDFNINPALEGIKIIESDIEDDLNLEKKYDAVIMADVIEHVKSPRKLFKDVLGCLNENGLIFLSVPNAGHFYNGLLLTLFPRHLNMSSAFGPWGHYYFFTFYSLKKMFEIFDLEVVEYRGSSFEFRYMGMSLIKRIAMWILNLIPTVLNFGFMRKYFSDHLYFILRKKNDNFLKISVDVIYEANI